MKIDSSMIGKRFCDKEGVIFTVLALHKNNCWLETRNGTCFSSTNQLNWELVEEPKKPSERIQEIVNETMANHSCIGFCQLCANSKTMAIERYLDEVIPKLMDKK